MESSLEIMRVVQNNYSFADGASSFRAEDDGSHCSEAHE